MAVAHNVVAAAAIREKFGSAFRKTGAQLIGIALTLTYLENAFILFQVVIDARLKLREGGYGNRRRIMGNRYLSCRDRTGKSKGDKGCCGHCFEACHLISIH